MAQGKVSQTKEKDFDKIFPRFTYTDMEEEMRKAVINLCRDAYKRQHDGEFKYYRDMALFVKKALDKDFGGAWHVVVGKSHIIVNLMTFSVYRHQLR